MGRKNRSGMISGLNCFLRNHKELDPETFSEAWDHHNSIDRTKWRTYITDEITTMIKKKVWDPIDKKDLPSDKKPLKMKWVFKEKNSGRYRARLVAKVFFQVYGKDFDLSHSPVLSEVPFRLLLLKYLHNDLYDLISIDVEKDFLEPNLKEHIYIKKPEGLDKVEILYEKTSHCKLNKAVYGLVQDSKCFYEELTKFILTKNYEVHEGDPCILKKRGSINSTIYMGLYVDDLLIVGKKEIIYDEIKMITNKFSLRIIEKVEEFVGCSLIVKKNFIFLHQFPLIQNILQKYKDELQKIRNTNVPMTTRTHTIRPTSDDDKLSEKINKNTNPSLVHYYIWSKTPDQISLIQRENYLGAWIMLHMITRTKCYRN